MQVGCPISTKKLTMREEFLTSADEIYAALTEQQVHAIILSLLNFESQGSAFKSQAS